MHTIEEAKQFLKENQEKGVDCPCCGRIVKAYKYNLNAGMALAMIGVYKLTKKEKPKDGWIHIQKDFAKKLSLNANALHYSLMKWWGLLISDRENPDPDKKSSGYWAITKRGIDFVEGRINVPSYVCIYDNHLLEVAKEDVHIEEALQKKFSYQELMGEYYNSWKDNSQGKLI